MYAQSTYFLLPDNAPPRQPGTNQFQPQVVNENDAEKQDAKGDYEEKKENEKTADRYNRKGRGGEMQQDNEVEYKSFLPICVVNSPGGD